MAQDIKDKQIYQELLWAMHEIKEDFERLMKRFQSQVYCPNECERQLWVEEGQDLVLDCALPWHGASHGAKTYSFYRGLAAAGAGPESPKPPPQSRGAAAEPSRPPPAERLLRSGPEPVLVWKEAAAAAAGRYRIPREPPQNPPGTSQNPPEIPNPPLPRSPLPK
ncbi:hypothetical protein DV515_00017865 [Chloebia gouldiae]|uniref:Izumo protein immunoglobulin domain-containing protein n=1 Tax=Chloebia gouldiae TaxID=44316 RepID=A0A3L8Q968_CHLGU|nr:hypothetical protein DV515_00017865 [Chloebia gouldiae]